MKKLAVITCVLALLFAFSSLAFAGDNDWIVGIDMGPTLSHGISIGVAPPSYGGGSNDGVDNTDWFSDIGNSDYSAWKWACTTLDRGTGDVAAEDYRSPFVAPAISKVWELRIAGATQYAGTDIPLRAVEGWAVGDLGWQSYPSVLGGRSVYHQLKMVNNRGKADAPANGTTWTIYSGWSLSSPLPLLKLSANTRNAMMSEGYVLEYSVNVIPEPSSLLALGAGLFGLAGFVARRRRP